MTLKDLVNARYDMIEIYYLRTRNVNNTFKKLSDFRTELLVTEIPDNPQRRKEIMDLMSVLER